MKATVSVLQAAEELGTTPATVRLWMREKLINIGIYSLREGCVRGSYIIYRHLLDAEKRRLGIE